MLTRKLDTAFDAMVDCRAKASALRDCYRPQTAERIAIEGLLIALRNADAALMGAAANLSYPADAS